MIKSLLATIGILSVLASTTASGQTVAPDGPADETWHFSIHCPSDDITLSFASPTQAADNDDMAVTLITGGHHETLSPIPPAWYTALEDVTASHSSVCSHEGNIPTTGYRTGKDRLLLFVGASGRPFYDYVIAILINTKNHHILDVQNIGRSKNTVPAIALAPYGFKVRLVTNTPTPGISCDCDASIMDAWMRLYIQKDKIKTAWLTK